MTNLRRLKSEVIELEQEMKWNKGLKKKLKFKSQGKW